MKKINFKIGIQLEIGFSLLLLLIMLHSIYSNFQIQKLQKQTETLLNHPYQVSNAISNMEATLLSMELLSKELEDNVRIEDRNRIVQDFEKTASEATKQMDLVKERYLGPESDVQKAFMAFTVYHAFLSKQMVHHAPVSNKLDQTKILELRQDLFTKLEIIQTFAYNKATSSYQNSVKIGTSLRRDLLFMVLFIVVVALVVNFILLRRIQKPLRILTKATHDFRHGDLNARSDYRLSNEFGSLSTSFNKLADQLQHNLELNKKISILSSSMLLENDTRTFFHTTLSAMLKLTNAQMAAIYIVSDDRNKLEFYESIGLGESFRKTFDLNTLEGEMGPVLATRKIQHIKEAQVEMPFVFETVYGSIRPREIMTIPLLVGERVIATIHLATINAFDQQSQLLIESTLETISARVSGILWAQKIKLFSEKLEVQNRELEMQKTELSKQSETLLSQNMELEVQKNQLNEANKLKTIFLSNMSHELRTPLNSVIALSGVLSRRLSKIIPAEEYSYLEVIERNGKHLLTLINDILDLSRIEAGREELEISRFDANALLTEVAELLKPQAEEKNIKLIFTVENNDLELCSDLNKCRHIVQNLVGNAIKFTEKGKVVMEVKKVGEFIQLDVIDTGIGISEAQQMHIFDEFRQADNSTSRRFGGTGLGLSIAKKYSELLGGSISVKSAPGKGSTFTLLLPFQCKEEPSPHEELPSIQVAEQRKSPAETDGKTILLVDDSEPAIIQLCDVLEEGGYSMLIARTGQEALMRIGEKIPDAMVLDLMMPGMDGFEVLKTLREEERTAHVPVLILTAKHITKEELRFLKRNNIHQLVQKGDINRRDLLKSIEEMAFKTKGTTRPTIMVVEDNPDNMLTAKALLSEQYEVLEATDGDEAIQMARLYLPNLILMDIELPGKDGIETFKVIRNDARLSRIPIIALTASAMTTERETILAYGFDGYIAKPIVEEIFSSTIKKILYG